MTNSTEFKAKTDKTCAICGVEKTNIIFSFEQYSLLPQSLDVKGTWVNVCYSCTREAVHAVLSQQPIHPGEYTCYKQ